MKDKRKYDDDDGRTIADMSGIDSYSLSDLRFIKKKSSQRGADKKDLEADSAEDKDSEDTFDPNDLPMTREDRRLYVFSALKAALLVAGVFMGGLAATIAILLLIWS